jgi:hypothetical protein
MFKKSAHNNLLPKLSLYVLTTETEGTMITHVRIVYLGMTKKSVVSARSPLSFD